MPSILPPLLPLFAQGGSNSAIVAFVFYMCIVLFLAWLSGRVAKKSSFLNEYFLGGRNLGPWAFALTFAATSASGGSFIGFPSLVYTHGWSLALWISSYMLVPLVAMGLLAKRLNQLARKTDAITVPDLILARFGSPTLGLVATLLIVFFTTFNLIAQFKGGSVILQTLLSDVPAFQFAAAAFGDTVRGLPLVAGVEPSYLLCLCVFAFAVIIYTTYGGFRAVVWTDVLQGAVMVLGIMVLLPMTLIAVGGLGKATQRLAESLPPQKVQVALTVDDSESFESGPILAANQLFLARNAEEVQLFRAIEAAQVNQVGNVLAMQTGSASLQSALRTQSPLVQVVALSGAFREQSSESLSPELRDTLDEVPLMYITEWVDSTSVNHPQPVPAVSKGMYTSWPGPNASSSSGFLPLSAAISFFFFWCFSSAGLPSNMVRCMAFRDSKTLSRAIFTVSVYYSLIYFPIVIIFCCARDLLPGWESSPDRIMPEMAQHVTGLFGVPWLAGLLVAAPFAAVMSTMDSFLLLISSSVVRDIYTRWVEPHPSQKRTILLTYTTTFCVGIVAMIAAINPPQFLQEIIVFTGAGLSTAFLAPVALALYWPRFNYQGALAGMLSGFISNIALYAIGSWQAGKMTAFEPFGLSPFLVGSILSLVMCLMVCLITQPPKTELVRQFFYRAKA